MLVDTAGHWWESVSRTRTEAQQCALMWIQFKDKEMGKYFPQALRDQKEREFLQLKQGKMKLEDYERKFEQLSRYAPHLVDTEAKKASWFELGLRPKIGGILASHQFTTYSRVLKTAQTISNRLEIDQTPQQGVESLGKRKLNGSNEGKREGPNKKHVYYRCGKTWYISKNCKEDPSKKNDEPEKKDSSVRFSPGTGYGRPERRTMKELLIRITRWRNLITTESVKVE
ncbi:uncharacterized protein LOC111398090 [Olea europaea var. sylvestris]|uniref:uncharacterized protein LOC111398090 n=1 Tax=Olea europaea var. sylvestris TaxID=158386 RepID=UPI000C1D0569|nr:uncharacterized protein LOC111398090 [Olea europaea var. sylvestris]